MSKKIIILIILFLIIATIAITAIIVTSNINKDKILQGNNVSKIDDDYVENNKINKSPIDIANELLTKNNLILEKSTLSNSKISEYDNTLESRKETVVSGDEYIIKFNTDTQEFISYINNKTSLEKNSLDKNTIKKNANEIFQKLDIADKEKYILDYIEKFDDEIWRAGFIKKYDDMVNRGECVKFSFAPQTGEIVSLAVNNIKYANNSVVLTEEEARSIASNYLKNKEELTSTLEIVRPNYFYKNQKNEGEIYININETRKAYVFKDKYKNMVYIDCTTGKVIGGDALK